VGLPNVGGLRMEQVWHYPQDLFDMLVDTIPRLCRSKRDVILFFVGAAVPDRYYSDLAEQVERDRASVNKFEIVRKVLRRLNDDESDRALKARREVIWRIVSFEDFASCWDNDRLAAQGLVEQIRKRVNQHDAFARMEQEYEKERSARQAESTKKIREAQRRREALERIRSDLNALFSERNPQRRGKACEGVLNRLFEATGVLVREAFTVTEAGVGVIEQIDGAVEIDGQLYLVEVKWWTTPVGMNEIAPHLVRLYARGNAHGIYISASPYTEPAIATCRDALRDRAVVLCTLEEIVFVLERELELGEFLRRKIRAATLERNPFYEPLKDSDS